MPNDLPLMPSITSYLHWLLRSLADYGSRGCRFESCRARVWLRQTKGPDPQGNRGLWTVSERVAPRLPFWSRVHEVVHERGCCRGGSGHGHGLHRSWIHRRGAQTTRSAHHVAWSTTPAPILVRRGHRVSHTHGHCGR